MNKMYEEEYKRIGMRIAYYRKLRGMTQEDLAKAIRKSAGYLGHIEAPRINVAISLDTLFDIAIVLDVPAYKFLMFDD